MNSELKPCPFCGGEPSNAGQRIYCVDCGTMPKLFDTKKDSLNAHKKLWNTRPPACEGKEWPKKMTDNDFGTDIGKFSKGWNHCHDAFMAVINSHSASMGNGCTCNHKIGAAVQVDSLMPCICSKCKKILCPNPPAPAQEKCIQCGKPTDNNYLNGVKICPSCLYKPAQTEEEKLVLCKCNKDRAMTVRKVSEDFFKCPRCGGLMVINKEPVPKVVNVGTIIKFLDDYPIKSALCFSKEHHECADFAEEIIHVLHKAEGGK